MKFPFPRRRRRWVKHLLDPHARPADVVRTAGEIYLDGLRYARRWSGDERRDWDRR